MVQELTAIEEFDNLCDLPGGCNILAAGKNTPIWQSNNQSTASQFYQTPQQNSAVIKNAGVKDNSFTNNANTVKIRY